jgi:hypothetical protein
VDASERRRQGQALMAKSIQVIMSFYPAFRYLEIELAHVEGDRDFLGAIINFLAHAIIRSDTEWDEDTSYEDAYESLLQRGVTPDTASRVLRTADMMIAQTIITHIPDFGGKGYRGIVNYSMLGYHDVRIEITPGPAQENLPGHRLPGST